MRHEVKRRAATGGQIEIELVDGLTARLFFRQIEPDYDNIPRQTFLLWIISDLPWHIESVGGGHYIIRAPFLLQSPLSISVPY